MKNEAQYYFPHDVRARSDIKIRAVVSEFGLAGYGAWWVVVELLRESEGYAIPDAAWSRKALEAELPGIDVDAFLALLVDTGLLVRENGGLSSPSLLRRMGKLDDLRAKRSEAGARGGRKKKAEPETMDEPEIVQEKPAAAVTMQMNANPSEDIRLRELVEHIAEDIIARYPVKTENRPEIEKAVAKAVRFQKLTLDAYRAGMSAFLREYAPFVRPEFLPRPENWLAQNKWLDNWRDLGATKRNGSKGGNNGTANTGGASTLLDQIKGV